MAEVSGQDGADAAAPKKSGKKGLLAALVGAVLAGGGGFYATYAGYLDGVLPSGKSVKGEMSAKAYSFVPLEPLIISLGPRANADTLKFKAELEVEPGSEKEVAALKPRIADVLNGYLRAVEEAELEDPGALAILRAQMLRRIQTVVGDGRVRDLLILEFVLN